MHEQIFVTNKIHFIIFVHVILFTLVIGNQFADDADWKYSTSENKYQDLFIKTESKIKLGTGILNYTVNFLSNKTDTIQIEYYPILEVNNVKKQIENNKNVFRGFFGSFVQSEIALARNLPH